MLQISALAQFIVINTTGSICANVQYWLEKSGYQEAQCFDVEATLPTSSILMLTASVLVVVVPMVAFRLLGAAVRDRDDGAPEHDTGRCSLTRVLLRWTQVPKARIRAARDQTATANTTMPVVAHNPTFRNDIDV